MYSVTKLSRYPSCIRLMGTNSTDFSENERMDYDVVIVGVSLCFKIIIFIGRLCWFIYCNSFKERSCEEES